MMKLLHLKSGILNVGRWDERLSYWLLTPWTHLPLADGDTDIRPRGFVARPSPLAPITPLNYRLAIIASHAPAWHQTASFLAVAAIIMTHGMKPWNWMEINCRVFEYICRHELLLWCLPARKFRPQACVQCLAGSRDWLNVLLAIWLFALGSLVRISYRWINPELAK